MRTCESVWQPQVSTQVQPASTFAYFPVRLARALYIRRVHFLSNTFRLFFRFMRRAAFASGFEFSQLLAWLVSKTENKIIHGRLLAKIFLKY